MLALILVHFMGINRDMFLEINSFAAREPSFIWANLTFMGDTMASLSVLLLFIRKRPDLVWSAVLAAILGTVIVNMFKAVLIIPRPPAIIESNLLNIIGPAIQTRSFPSGHTTTIYILFSLLMFAVTSFAWRAALAAAAFLVGISRIAVGVHWPADVLAGAAIGCFCGTSAFYFINRLKFLPSKRLLLIVAILLIVSDLYMLLFYDSGYPQARSFQRLLAIITLIIGSKEIYLMWNRR